MIIKSTSNKATQNCDQCSWELQKCDKESPVCSNCRLAKRKCTRNKVTKYRVFHNFKSIQCLKTNGKGKPRVDQLKKVDPRSNSVTPKMHPKTNDVILINQTSLARPTAFLFQSEWKHFLRRCFQDSTSWYNFYYFSRVSGIPIFTSSHTQKMMIYRFINSMKLPSKKSSVSLCLQHSPSYLGRDMEQAVDSFLNNVNSFYPLFRYKSIYSRPRTIFLKVCICRVGLQFLRKSALRTDAMNYLDNLILYYLKPSNLKPSLDSIQGLLIVLLHCHSYPLIQYRSRIFSILSIWVHLLGLDLIISKSHYVECQMALGLIYGFESYFSNVISAGFLPPLSFSFKPNFKLGFVNLYLQEWSVVAKDAAIYLTDSELSSKPDAIFSLLQRLDKIVQGLVIELRKIKQDHHTRVECFIAMIYHYNYLVLIDIIFKLNTKTLKKFSKKQISLLKRTGYVHSLLAVQKSILLQNPALVSHRILMLLKVSKILNSWAAPCPPGIQNIISRSIIRTNTDSIQDLNNFALLLVDHYFKKNDWI